MIVFVPIIFNNIYIIFRLGLVINVVEAVRLGVLVDVMSVPVRRFDAQSDAILICLYSNKSIDVSLLS
jgi:hypothetical protein